jgi:hypothetical protein
MASIPLNEQIKWLKTRQEALLDDVISDLDDIPEKIQKEIISDLIKYVRISQEIQNLGFLAILTHMVETQSAIDDELMDISDYMATILSIHRKEAENLEKLI